MKKTKRINIIFLAFASVLLLLASCKDNSLQMDEVIADTNTSIDDISTDNSSIDIDKAERPYIISGYTTYNPHKTAQFLAEVTFRVSYYHSAAENEEFLLRSNPNAVTIALITLEYVDFENATEYMPEEKPTAKYTEPFCSTPVTVKIDKVLLSENENLLTENEKLSSTVVLDRWKEQPDGSYVIEYFENEFPMCEQGKQYVAALIKTDNGFKIDVLSFPVNPDGSYTESILEHRDSDCFKKEQWSFSDEVLKKYGITE